MRIFLRLTIPLLVILAGQRAFAQSPPPQRAAPLKVAILATESSAQKSENVAAILTAALSDAKSFTLVERQSVRRVLNEQTLQSLSDAAGSARFGQLVGADLLLYCQTLKNTKPELLRVRIVETKSGVILADQIEDFATLAAKPESFKAAVDAAVKKAAIPVADRKLVGLIGVSSAEPGKALDPLTTSLDVLLRSDLAESPNVVVLEREQLRHLTSETALSGMDVKLRASARLIEVKAKRDQGNQGGNKMDFTVRITDLTGGKGRTLDLSIPSRELQPLRRPLLEAILKTLAVPLPENAIGDIAAEAKAFHERSVRLLLSGYVKEALPFAVTAYSLDPKPEYHANLARVCNDIFDNIRPSIGNGMTIMRARAHSVEELSAVLLLQEIDLDAAHRTEATLPPDLKYSNTSALFPSSSHFDDLQSMFPLPETPQTPEQKLIVQLLGRSREEHEVWMEIYRQHHWPTRRLELAYAASVGYRVRSAAEYCTTLHKVFEDFETEQATGPEKDPTTGRDQRIYYPDVSMICLRCLWSGNIGNIKLTDCKPLFIWLTQRKNPVLQFEGWNAIASLSFPDADAAAFKALDAIYRTKIPPNFQPGWAYPVESHESNIRVSNSGKKNAYVNALLSDLEKAKDPLPLLRWTRETEGLTDLPDNKDRLALELRMQKLIASQPVPQLYSRNLKSLQGELVNYMKYARKQLGGDQAIPNPWDKFTLREIHYNHSPAGAPKLIWASVDFTQKQPDLMLLWRSDPINENNHHADFTFVVTRMALKGGQLDEIARTKLQGPVYRDYGEILGFRITSVLSSPDGIVIADFRRGLIVTRHNKISVLTEKNGLVTNQIWSLAWANNELYAGADDGFMTVDPKTGACKTLGSANAVPSLNPFDGGNPYRIANILPSPDGKSLWLAVGSDQSRLGLWRYVLATRTFEHTLHIPDKAANTKGSGPFISWHDGKLLVLGISPGLYDANSGTLVKPFRGQGMYDVNDFDAFPDERSTTKTWIPIDYTPQHRTALTSIGFITRYGGAVQPAGGDEFSIWRSHLADPMSQRNWYVVQEVGNDLFAAAYWDSIDHPRLMLLTPPKP